MTLKTKIDLTFEKTVGEMTLSTFPSIKPLVATRSYDCLRLTGRNLGIDDLLGCSLSGEACSRSGSQQRAHIILAPITSGGSLRFTDRACLACNNHDTNLTHNLTSDTTGILRGSAASPCPLPEISNAGSWKPSMHQLVC